MLDRENNGSGDPKNNLIQVTNQKITPPQTDYQSLPVHTMKDDLHDILNPQAAAKNAENEKILSVNTPEKSGESISPFLSQENWGKNTVKILENPAENQEKKPSGETKFKKIILASVITFVVLAIGIGSYYFWVMRTSKVAENNSASLPEVPKEENLPNKNLFADKPNYINADISDSSLSLKEILDPYIQKVARMETKTPVEFIITDIESKNIKFQVFAEKAGIKLPQGIINLLEPDFGLFIYNDQGNIRIGLKVSAINSLDTAPLSSEILKEEVNLTTDLEPIFLSLPYTLENKNFGQSNYKNIGIRYNNIISPTDLSIDYALYDGKWLVGTTKMTLRAMIDYQENQLID